MLTHYNFSLIPIRLKKCVIKSSILIFPQYNFFMKSQVLKKTCDKAVDRYPFIFDSIPDLYKT